MVSLRAHSEPFTRVGICCGARCRARERHPDVPLYRVRDHVYRCAACYKRETGYRPS